ncbi:hypothetical protein H5410_000464 [Solanum commersonii]|uniref:Uncharacterized protein n=1 Tax=Solanum commersonii TaxID=4109 RepID=A0A9J6AWZ5_SOLCO|nr:hypothetical protein H5410_000464 [Solanum commersonii]
MKLSRQHNEKEYQTRISNAQLNLQTKIGCCIHTLSTMESIGTPFVSGKKKKTNNPMTTIHPEKKKKM